MILKPLPFSLRPTKVLLSIGKMDKKDNLNFRGSAEKIIRNNEYIPEKNIKEIQPCDMVSSQTQFEALPRVVSLPYRNITRFNVFGRKSEVEGFIWDRKIRARKLVEVMNMNIKVLCENCGKVINQENRLLHIKPEDNTGITITGGLCKECVEKAEEQAIENHEPEPPFDPREDMD